MYNKFFTVEVKPPIDASLLNAAALASDDDVIFSWTPFEVPKGSSRLLNVTARVAGNNGTAQHHPFQLLFAKGSIDPTTGAMSAPASIGTYNTVATAINSLNQIQGGIKIEAIDYMCQSLVGCSIASTGNSVAANGSNVDMVLTPAGSPHVNYLEGTTVTSITPGYDVLWVAGIACGAFNFASTVTTDGTVTAVGKIIHTDTKDANLVFSKGDVIQELDNTVIGTIFQIDEVVNNGGDGAATVDVNIHVDREIAGDGRDAIADGVKIYHRNPITLELSFEK
tara:strand:+ start:26 stop:868 length:843 start_codon:yes stop_codon:yes gene_type:complete